LLENWDVAMKIIESIAEAFGGHKVTEMPGAQTDLVEALIEIKRLMRRIGDNASTPAYTPPEVVEDLDRLVAFAGMAYAIAVRDRVMQRRRESAAAAQDRVLTNDG
jgi:hypothetical protein